MSSSSSVKLQRKNLVILRAGDHSLHHHWMAEPQRDFDIFVSYYGNTPHFHAETADFYEMRPGPKWSCIAQLLAAHPQLREAYDAFWFPDDDLLISTDEISRMFAFFHAFKLSLAQPALTHDSYYSWKTLLQDQRYVVRDARFVEVMAPIFDRHALKVCEPSFSESRSGWGLDWLWPELLKREGHDQIAIIDATPIKHTRPVGGNLYANNPDLDPQRDAQRIREKYQLHPHQAGMKYQGLGGVRRVQPSLWERTHLKLRALNNRRLAKRREHT